MPRFHIAWGAGPGVVEPFERRVREGVARGLVTLKFRHRVDSLTLNGGALAGVAGTVLEPSSVSRGQPSSRTPVGEFELGAPGGDRDLGRDRRQPRARARGLAVDAGPPPERMLSGVPDYVDGRMLKISADAGARIINPDRMWHYTEGIENWNPIWTRHGIRILPGPSPLWFDATGRRLPVPLFPGFDTLGTLEAPDDDRTRLQLVRAHPEDHRARVRAVGLRAEPRPDLEEHCARCSRAGSARARRRRSRRSSATASTSSSSTTCARWSAG